MSFRDYLLEHDTTGELHAIVAEQRADREAGVTWGLFDGDKLIGTHPARHLAEFDRHDAADATDRPVSSFTIRQVATVHAEVAA